MVEPQRILKDSVLSVVTIDNFEESVVPERYHSTMLSYAAQCPWWLDVVRRNIGGIEYLSMSIRHGDLWGEKYSAANAISLRNDTSIDTKTFTFTCDYCVLIESWGFPQFIELSEVLAENSGFLRNGALTVQCEVRVDAITDNYGICRFNFHDPFEGCVKFTLQHGLKYYARKEIIAHHLPPLAERIAAGKEEFTFRKYGREDFEWYLQVVHGLSAEEVPSTSLIDILQCAVCFDTISIIQRYDTIFSEFTDQVKVPSKFASIFLKRQLKRVKSLEELKEVVEREAELLETEMMKSVASKFFSFAVDYREGPNKSV